MLIPVLATKLYIPSPPPKVVLRPRLTERLSEGLCQDQGFGRKLTLISAPAGFGKTSLVSEWAAGCDRQVAWLSLDEADSDPSRFLTYLVAALQTVAPAIGEGVLQALQVPQPPAIESILTALVNEITALPGHFVLVLDDYHLIDSQSIDDAVTFLIERLPPQMRLIIATREDPRLPLARLRARGQLTELRAAELRFTSSEAAGFLLAMNLSLSAEDLEALETRTEGWIAGLQLAALAMQNLSVQGHQDVTRFIRSFAGDHRYIVDFLVEEVLQRQPEHVRSFLLQTAILDRLNGSLCDAVTGQENGSARLEALERGNFFVIPLDDQRYWYRYHHLFADVLYAHLMAEQPDRVSALHRRASEWYEHYGSAADAIRHALAAKDFERAANLVELAIPAMRRSRQEAAVLSWLNQLPGELLYCRPVLSVHYAGALLVSGELEGVEARLQDAEQWLVTMADMGERPEAPPAETWPESIDGSTELSIAPDKLRRRMVVVDKEEFRRLPGSIAIYRAASALALGDVHDTLKYARRALDLVSEEDHLGHGAAAGFLGLVYWRSGDLEAAHRSYAGAMASLQKAGHVSDAIGCAIALADIRIAQGRLSQAMSTYERGLQLAAEQGALVLRGAADMHVGMSGLLRERNDLDAAMQQLLRSKELGEHTGLPQNRYRWRVAMARLQEAGGDLDGALDLLSEAERLYVSDFFPDVRPLAALKTRVRIAQGRLGEAIDWAREQDLSAHDDLSYLREFEHITLARLLLAQYQSDRAGGSILEAMGLLERLLKEAEVGGRTGSVIEILVLQALACQMQGDIPAALAPLERALALAEPEGYLRVFVDEGQSMKLLIADCRLQIAQRARSENKRVAGKSLAYIDKLLAAFPGSEAQAGNKRATKDQSEIYNRGRTRSHNGVRTQSAMVEPLSQRELEVLRLFKTELSGPEIARELMIGLSTVRTHTKSIYSKLKVNNRRAAVSRAAELGLL